MHKTCRNLHPDAPLWPVNQVCWPVSIHTNVSRNFSELYMVLSSFHISHYIVLHRLITPRVHLLRDMADLFITQLKFYHYSPFLAIRQRNFVTLLSYNKTLPWCEGSPVWVFQPKQLRVKLWSFANLKGWIPHETNIENADGMDRQTSRWQTDTQTDSGIT